MYVHSTRNRSTKPKNRPKNKAILCQTIDQLTRFGPNERNKDVAAQDKIGVAQEPKKGDVQLSTH